VTRAAAALVVLAALALPAAAPAFPTHVPVALTKIPGNTCCPKYTRAAVSSTGVLTKSTMTRGGSWKTVGRRHLSASELKRLRSELSRFNPQTLRPTRSAGCGGAPIGDVGGNDLRVGQRESNCPPTSAKPLIKLLSGWLPKA
jgi:hypothetical protein